MRYFTLITLCFIAFNASFAQEDASAQIQDSTILYQTPMLYELVNIAYALTDTNIYIGQKNHYFNTIDTSKLYYKAVIEHFKGYKNHRFVRVLNRELRWNSVTYMWNLTLGSNLIWKENSIKKADFFSPDLVFLDIFGRKKHLLQDFARQTNFEVFYKQHQAYYTKNLADAQRRLDVTRIKKWLEQEFPSRYDRYNIVISPLMYGWHFTQYFKQKKMVNMWVSDAQNKPQKYTETQFSGVYTGVVFTEIDHNYVNPVSDTYKKELNKIMGGAYRSKWLKPDGDAKLYTNGYAVFNEYMTHAVYLIYTNKIYSADDQKVIEQRRIEMMHKYRKYVLFEAFYKELKDLYEHKKDGENLASLYPKIIAWVRAENVKK